MSPPIETELQQLIVDACKEFGGKAVKLNNRFIIGVPDLLVQLPGHPAFFLEAKRQLVSPKTRELIFNLDVTVKQKQFLSEWYHAGMRANGVVSFTVERGGDVRSARMLLLPLYQCNISEWRASLSYHEPLGDARDRLSVLYGLLIMYVQRMGN